MDRYIEVIGEGEFIETAQRFIAEVTLEVRATKDETALQEVGQLRADAIRILSDAGIVGDEITEGGTEYARPWYWKKQVGQNASRKLILKVKDFPRLNTALEQLEPLQSRQKDRKTISVTMRQPEFEESGEGSATALAAAFADAKQKASRLAQGMECRLGPVLHVEEGSWSKRNSGFAGDADWGGDYSRFAMGGGIVLAAAAGGESEPELPRPTRTIFVKCRVRFALES